MKHVLLYAATGELAKARELFPAHQAQWKEFLERKELLMIGPFSDPQQGAMAIFATREAAEEFVKRDPFVLQGVVKTWEIREWREAVVPEPGP